VPCESNRNSPGSAWKWWVCGLLMLATMINYMDRQTLSQTGTVIKKELHLNNEQYGQIEGYFGLAFALGSLVTGWMVDRWRVRWIYPAAVVVWSAAGFATGFSQTLGDLFLFRFLLGLAEAANWPCALRTTQHLLPPEQRTMGNAILQSGASLGAIATPFIILALVSETAEGSWRYPFFIIGAIGIGWAFLWLSFVRRDDWIRPQFSETGPLKKRWRDVFRSQQKALAPIIADRRFWLLVIVVVVINTTWHFFRAWQQIFLKEEHGFSLEAANRFSPAYYVFTDAGALCSGFATLYLARRGWSVHRSRLLVYFFCALLTLLSILVAFLPKENYLLFAFLPKDVLLVTLLLVIGFGSLGMFPVYYSLTQDITVRHQGKVNGMLGCINWLFMAVLHPGIGKIVDWTGSHSLGIALVGPIPMIGFLVLLFFWKERGTSGNTLPH
jgi:MFS transporter, ACS family, hexuronate transporter